MAAKSIDTSKFVASEKFPGAIKGASCVYYYPSLWGRNYTKVILIKHKTDDYGAPGGLADPNDKDITATAIRETGEELRDANGQPVLKI